jgi:23S rRNA (cytosine1962-C5)-methyltransferase
VKSGSAEHIRLPESGVVPVRGGHPWVFRDVRVQSKPGEPVVLCDPRGRPVAWGVADEGPIAVRVLGREVPDVLDMAVILRERVLRADRLRAQLLGADGDVWRVVHGEGDRLSGLVIDRYADVAVVRLYAKAWERWIDPILGAVREAGWARSVVRRLGVARVDGGTGLVRLAGPEVADRVIVQEGPMRLAVSVREGQKTGMFIDQREHRALVGRWSRGRRVANLFAYHGGFSLAAALGGAEHVTTVDLAPAAVEDAKANFRLNGLDPDRHAFEVADAFAWRPKGRLDLLVLDPPSLAHDRKTAGAARSAYRKLHRHHVSALGVDALLATSSCTSWVDMATWVGSVEQGFEGRDAAWLWRSGAPPDHPVAVGHAEGAYLKFGLLRAL